MATTVQPKGKQFRYTEPWTVGIFDCCTDFKTLFCACCCFPFFLCDLDRDAGVIY